jgi:type IV pilus assembly protein PilN
MIRINLLPHRREATQDGSQRWIFALVGVLFVQVVVIFFIHHAKTNELADQMRINQELDTQIGKIRAQVADHNRVKGELATFIKREAAISKLQKGRTGPTSVLLELGHVMTRGRGPTVDREKLAQLQKDNPLAAPNPSWDPRRLWLLSLKEANRIVTIEGLARNGEDVSELARRLSLSNFFIEVKLLPASKMKDPETKAEFLKFQLQAKVMYLWLLQNRPRKVVWQSCPPQPKSA